MDIDQQIQRRMLEHNAITSVELTGRQWRAIQAVIASYKPGNDRAKKHNHELAMEACVTIQNERDNTDQDLAQEFETEEHWCHLHRVMECKICRRPNA